MKGEALRDDRLTLRKPLNLVTPEGA